MEMNNFIPIAILTFRYLVNYKAIHFFEIVI